MGWLFEAVESDVEGEDSEVNSEARKRGETGDFIVVVVVDSAEDILCGQPLVDDMKGYDALTSRSNRY